MDAILLVGHGSRDPEGNRELKEFAREVAEQAPENTLVETCFLELTRPSIADGVTACVDRGATRVVLVPIILFAAGHAKIDIPNAIDRAKARYPQVQFIYGRPIGVHEKVVQIMQTRLQEAQPVRITAQGEGETDTAVAVAAPPAAVTVTDEETAVLVLGRGVVTRMPTVTFQNDPHVVGETALQMGGEQLYRGDPAFFPGWIGTLPLAWCEKIIVMPYFLFTGVLIKRIDEMTAEFAAAHPDIQVEIGVISVSIRSWLSWCWNVRTRDCTDGLPQTVTTASSALKRPNTITTITTMITGTTMTIITTMTITSTPMITIMRTDTTTDTTTDTIIMTTTHTDKSMIITTMITITTTKVSMSIVIMSIHIMTMVVGIVTTTSPRSR